ncbi:hypothetical protein TNIN_228611 [Trichonephila inaurata madagascariensis]|uniref:Uncharacterized protein n=1 Tax=Trichonephila inaurata madagascariensis TaxID=2747483 RepID=A0A8X6WVB2_9ARAC|nr:hypothetical protein TNIN_228611 [Trichonephila inaurata madagascariensis]
MEATLKANAFQCICTQRVNSGYYFRPFQAVPEFRAPEVRSPSLQSSGSTAACILFGSPSETARFRACVSLIKPSARKPHPDKASTSQSDALTSFRC